MGRVIAVVVCLVGVAACGGSSSGKSAPPETSTSTTTTTVESAETQAFVAAAAKGLSDPDSAPEGMTAEDATCLARALVGTITVDRLKAAGVTTTQLSDPDEDLPATLAPSVPAATQIELGEAMQACGIGRLIGSLLTDSVAESVGGGYRPKAQEQDCVAAWFDATPQRKFVAELVLNPGPTRFVAQSFARAFVDCLDVATMVATEFPFTLTDEEKACINTEARTDEQFIAALADEIQGTASASASTYELFGARAVKCLTPEHILDLRNTANPDPLDLKSG